MNELKLLTLPELFQRCWDLLRVRAHPGSTKQELIQLLLSDDPTPNAHPNPVNQMREEIIAYINTDPNQLSLYCNGRCYEHPDLIVVSCYQKLREVLDG
jgi:septum formation topological specificity factor MinE